MSDDVIDRIEHDHRELEQIFAKLESADGNAAELLRQIADELIPHSKAEEQLVYPAVREAVPPEGEEVKDGTAEHHHIEEMLEQLLAEGPEAPGADGIQAAVIAELRHHIEEEEQDLLPAFREASSQEQRDELGRHFQEAKEQVRAGGSGSGSGGSGGRSRDELYQQAKEAGIEGRSKMSKDELARAVDEL